MAEQPSSRPLEASEFFADGQSARRPILGTVARGNLRVDNALYLGLSDKTVTFPTKSAYEEDQKVSSANRDTARPRGAATRVAGFSEDRNFVQEFPLPVSQPMIEHGRNRYMIYCVVCHDPLGTGTGRVVERGYSKPPSFHIERLRQAPIGRLFAVVSEGYGSMPSYAKQISAEDRWAIVAYVKALQLSQHFPTDRLTSEMRAALEQASLTPAMTEMEEENGDG